MSANEAKQRQPPPVKVAKNAGGIPKSNELPATPGNNAQLIGIVVALLVVLITIYFLLTRGKKKGRTVLLVGASDVGKTALFAKLWQNKNVETVTSVIPNEGEYEVGSGRGNLILKDLPGNDRVRQKHWEDNRSGVRGVICVIDAAGGNKAVRDAAEVLYWVLTDPVVTSLRPEVLVFANKQDLPTSKSVRVIKASLEREITTLRLTKSASLQSTGGSSTNSSKTLGRPDKDFEFEQLLPTKVEFTEGTANSENDDDIKHVRDWLQKIA